MRTIFITGASSGLGKASAKLFAENGWRVIATMRNPDKETDLNQLDNVILLPLEVTDLEQIKDTTQKAISLGVDVVLNNAGYGLSGPLENYTDEQMVKQIDTNLLGVMRVTQAFIPYFRTKNSGLFLTTTSIGGLITFPFYSVYCASKWALEGFCESLWFELKQFGIGVKTIAPGGIKSSFRNSADRVQNDIYSPLVDKVTDAFMTGKTPTISSAAEDIAAVIYEAATDGKDQLRYAAGEDAKAYIAQRLELGAEAFRENLDGIFFGG